MGFEPNDFAKAGAHPASPQREVPCDHEPTEIHSAPNTLSARHKQVPSPFALMATGALLLDPAQVDDSQWGTRSPASFVQLEYVRLSEDIKRTGGNCVPVLVRPRESTRAGEPGFELIYGQRRLRACRDQGLQVRACVQALTDSGAAVRIHAENSLRKNLAPIEQGEFYKRLLESRVYPSLRRLAADLGVDAGDASRKLFLANLPRSVRDAVQDPSKLSCAHARELSELMAAGIDNVARAAKAARAQFGPLKPKELLRLLRGAPLDDRVGNSNTEGCALFAGGVQVGVWRRVESGSLMIELTAASSSDDKRTLVLKAIECALAGKSATTQPA